jgi:hypothetical protein
MADELQTGTPPAVAETGAVGVVSIDNQPWVPKTEAATGDAPGATEAASPNHATAPTGGIEDEAGADGTEVATEAPMGEGMTDFSGDDEKLDASKGASDMGSWKGDDDKLDATDAVITTDAMSGEPEIGEPVVNTAAEAGPVDVDTDLAEDDPAPEAGALDATDDEADAGDDASYNALSATPQDGEPVMDEAPGGHVLEPAYPEDVQGKIAGLNDRGTIKDTRSSAEPVTITIEPTTTTPPSTTTTTTEASTTTTLAPPPTLGVPPHSFL